MGSILRGSSLPLVLLLASAIFGSLGAQEFDVELDQVISPGVPGVGAGNIESNGAVDTYKFTVGAGQLVGFRLISESSTFQRNLAVQLFAPGGTRLFDDYTASLKSRLSLAAAGTYTLRVYVVGANPSRIGTYSLVVYPIPADKTFPIAVGDTISDGQPGVGAGQIESIGTEDWYTFTATAGQIVGFQRISQASAFDNSLAMQLFTPTGTRLFDDYFGSLKPRLPLTEAGTYRIRVYVFAPALDRIGAYSFRLFGVAEDKTFPVSIGSTISPGVPAVGAGRIEALGTQDFYTFSATAGQLIQMESISTAPTFDGLLTGELRSPSGTRVFDDYFSSFRNRVALPESGVYSLRVYVFVPTATRIGDYSFKITGIAADATFPITPGQVVGPGQPSTGAGVIEANGSQDFYTFAAVKGQRAHFESILAAPAFENNLAGKLTSPSGSVVFDDYFRSFRRNVLFNETGTYRLQVYVVSPNASRIGNYSFRYYIPVEPRPDSIATVAGLKVSVPVEKLLANDDFQDPDDISMELISATSPSGGQLTLAAGKLSYQPAPGYIGIESIPVRIRGTLGGVETNRLTAVVVASGNQPAHVVNSIRLSPQVSRFCVMGKPGQSYNVLRSEDLKSWVPDSTIQIGPDGVAPFNLTQAATGQRFYQFRFP